MDPRNKSEDDERECVSENDFTSKSLLRANFPLLSPLRGDNRGQAIYELGKRGMTIKSQSYSCLTRVSRIFKWILGTSPRMTIKNECPRMTVNLSKVLGMTMLCCLIMTGTAYAECTPAPDCVELGYTETSCNGGFVRCPFDINKLFCLPCDSSYKYDCSGDNITGGVGSVCNGKYIECEYECTSPVNGKTYWGGSNNIEHSCLI